MSNETTKRVLNAYRALRMLGEMVGEDNATINGHNVAGAGIIFIEADERWREFTEAMHLLATEESK